MYYKRSPLAYCMRSHDNTYILGFGTIQSFIDKTEFDLSYKLLSFLEEKKNDDEIEAFLKENSISKLALENLINKKMVTTWEDIMFPSETTNYKNKLYLEAVFNAPDKIDNNIKDAAFIIIGCGGIGNFISFSLASLEPRKMVLIDGDIIEKTNLNRQFLFNTKNINEYKTDVLEKSINERFEGVELKNIRMFVDKQLLENVIKELQHDGYENIFIVLSGDSEGIVEDTTSIAVSYGISLINVGYLNDISIIGPFYIPGLSACPCCNSSVVNDTDEEEEEIVNKLISINNLYSAPSAFTNNAFASAMATVDILHFFSGEYSKINSLNQRVGLSNSTFEKMYLKIDRDNGCVVCGEQSIKEEYQRI